MWSSKKILWFLVFIAIVVASSIGVFTDSHFLIVNDVNIVVDKTDLDKSVKKQVHDRIMNKMHAFEKVNILSVPIERIQQQILSDVWVDSVVIERNFPDQLKVSVRLKKVVLVYLDSRGRFLPISQEAQLMNPVSPEQVPDVPVVRNSEIIKNPNLLKQILILYQKIPRSGVFSQQSIAEVDWSKSEGLIVESANAEGGRIVLGKDEVPLKSARVTNVIKYLESQKQKWRVIDASFTKKVLVRLRKHS
ncbi:MAG: FtsQ-type POTRA domain-containing protein [Bdellovibrionaceae bacterium]|nr:FtsQ-type POTRA domain-containing protein [Pseudobdellovibrionaceae bacterium]